MTAQTAARFYELLSSRARIGRTPSGGGMPPRPAPAASTLAPADPDPASFPYDELVEATARMLQELASPRCPTASRRGTSVCASWSVTSTSFTKGSRLAPENIMVANGSGHALALAISAFVDMGEPLICEAPTFHGTLATIRRHGRRS